MESNTHSDAGPTGPSAGLAALTAAVEQLAGQELGGLPDAVRAQRVLALRRLLDQLEGRWLSELAGVDARGAAGADQGIPAPSTAGWLRNRLQMGAGAAHSAVRTARALFGGPLTQTATALTAGDLSPAHAAVLAAGTHDLPAHVAMEAEPVLVEAARRLDPPRLRQVVAHLRLVADPDGAASQAERRHQQRGLRLAPPWRAWWPSTGCWTPRPARPSWPPWNPWPAPTPPRTTAAAPNAAPMPWPSWPAASWRAAGCPTAVGSGPS
jgi:Domain of unknown function (DUF222)